MVTTDLGISDLIHDREASSMAQWWYLRATKNDPVGKPASIRQWFPCRMNASTRQSLGHPGDVTSWISSRLWVFSCNSLFRSAFFRCVGMWPCIEMIISFQCLRWSESGHCLVAHYVQFLIEIGLFGGSERHHLKPSQSDCQKAVQLWERWSTTYINNCFLEQQNKHCSYVSCGSRK